MSEEQQSHGFWAELRRHPAFQAAVVFAGASWLLLQAADIFGLATTTVRATGVLLVTVFVLLVGFAVVGVARGGNAMVPARRVRTRTIAITTAVLLVLGTGAWFARPYVLAPLRPGADVIAVLPFSATGAGVDVLGEGLVDLLSTNLNEVGVIRTINPRTTLHHYTRVAPDGSIDLPGQLRVGREVGAGSVLVGSVVSTGSEVRITAELYSVETGNVIANAQQNGQPDNVLALVDQLSIQLLQDIWRARSPLPELRVSAITTQSVPALRAYMRGEQFYRRLRWDSAMAAFNEAVTHDSTFALANFRLGEVYGWSENLGSEAARRHSDAAARFAERLPARERMLVVAHQLHEQGSIAAIDSLQAYVNRFPDDVGGYYLLADARFHAGQILGLDTNTMLEAFERVFTMDSTFAPGYAHLLELTAMAGDSAKYERRLAMMRTLAPSEATLYQAVFDIRWHDRAHALKSVGTALRTDSPRRMQLITRVMAAASLRAFAESPDPDIMLAAIDSLRAIAGDEPQLEPMIILGRAGVLGTAGRIRETEALIAPLRAQGETSLNSSIQFIVSGVAPDDAFAPERAMLERAADRPAAAYWLAIQALFENDVTAAERHLAVIRADTARRAFIQPEMIDALQGWIIVAKGDSVAGVARMRNALRELGYSPSRLGPTGPLRLQLALLLAARPETRDEGFRRIEQMLRQGGGLLAFAAVPLAEAYVAAGRMEEARATYARFIELWRNADPELQPRVRAASEALARISGERGSA